MHFKQPFESSAAMEQRTDGRRGFRLPVAYGTSRRGRGTGASFERITQQITYFIIALGINLLLDSE